MRVVTIMAVAILAVLTLVILTISGVIPPGASATTFVYVFGDSNVDSGWYKVAPFSGLSAFDQFLQAASTNDIGKPTNNPGPMSVEVMASLLGTTANPATRAAPTTPPAGPRIWRQTQWIAAVSRTPFRR